jgi:hypothetical protein
MQRLRVERTVRCLSVRSQIVSALLRQFPGPIRSYEVCIVVRAAALTAPRTRRKWQIELRQVRHSSGTTNGDDCMREV